MANFEQYSDRAQYYDIEFHDASDRKILESIVDTVDGRVLEIPSGSGRNMWLAGKDAIDVVFADLNQSMVERVTKKLKKGSRGAAIQADMTDLTLGVFDLILIPREGLQLLSKHQLLVVLKSIRASLKDEGSVYIDIAKLRAPFSSPSHPTYITRQDAWYEDFDRRKDNVRMVRQHMSHMNSGILAVEYKFQVEDRGILRQFETSIELTEYSTEELNDAFKRAGLRIMVLYGNYKMKPYQPTDDRMIFLVQKDI